MPKMRWRAGAPPRTPLGRGAHDAPSDPLVGCGRGYILLIQRLALWLTSNLKSWLRACFHISMRGLCGVYEQQDHEQKCN